MKDRPDDGGSKHLWNDDKILPDYTAQHIPEDSHLHIRRRKELKLMFVCIYVFVCLPIYHSIYLSHYIYVSTCLSTYLQWR
jgi:hypothetical protein